MSFNIQQMLLISGQSTEEFDSYVFTLETDSSRSKYFWLQYQGKTTVDYGDGTVDKLNSSSTATRVHTYTA